MEAISTEESSNCDDTDYDEISRLPSVGHHTSSAAAVTHKPNLSETLDLIVLSDEENRPSPASGNLVLNSSSMSSKVPNSAHHIGTTNNNNSSSDSADPNVQALKELLLKEEKRLSVLKTIHDLQGAVVANSKTSIQGSALNKKGSRSSAGGGGGGSGRSSPNLRLAKPKHSIVVVPGHQPKTSSSSSTPTSSSSSSSSGATGISSRLQQLVDNIAVDHALTTCSERLKSSGKDTTTITMAKVASMSTPPVPGLTSIVPSTHSQKHTLAYISSSGGGIKTTSATGLAVPQIRPIGSSTTNIRSSHEVITISDSPVIKNPPPLLSSTAKTHMTTNGLIQVPTISSTVVPSTTTSSSNGSDKNYLLHAAEQSRRYREYLLKQNHARRNFQKQIERKMVVAPYPKTFRQVWPLIPVHDSAFVRNYGLEAVSHHFDSTSSTGQDKSVSKVKPVCNQCGCDFASAWQIRKSNSKQLLLCEACDFQNLKILQRSKLGNQLKELLESIKKEEDKFGVECEEARKQVLMLEKRAAESPPPPLLTNNNISNFIGQTKRVVLDNQISSRVQALANTATISGGVKKQLHQHHMLVGKQQSSVATISNNTTSTIPSTLGQKSFTPSTLGQKSSTPSTLGQKSSTPSTLGQKSSTPSTLGKKSSIMGTKKETMVTGLKRKEPPSHGGTTARQEGTPPPSKVYRPGSTLDLTLNRLSKQLITRKLDEQRKECGELRQVGESGETNEGPCITKPDSEEAIVAKPECVAAGGTVVVSAATASAGEKSKSRRKGTPKHRLCSASD